MRVQSLTRVIVLFSFMLLSILVLPSICRAENIKLQKPAMENTSFLEAEAGISAYTNVQQAVDLTKAKNGFRTIEQQTEDYIIGSVALLDYGEAEDVHAYVHKTGWIVAYYLSDEPAAKIVDWLNYGQAGKIYGTKLETGLSVLCNACQVAAREVKYYDFRCPEANKLLIVADASQEGGDTFSIKIPSGFFVFERSFIHFYYGSWEPSCLYIDNIKISEVSSYNYQIGLLSPVQLSVDDFHTIRIDSQMALCAIVLIYLEP